MSVAQQVSSEKPPFVGEDGVLAVGFPGDGTYTVLAVTPLGFEVFSDYGNGNGCRQSFEDPKAAAETFREWSA